MPNPDQAQSRHTIWRCHILTVRSMASVILALRLDVFRTRLFLTAWTKGKPRFHGEKQTELRTRSLHRSTRNPFCSRYSTGTLSSWDRCFLGSKLLLFGLKISVWLKMDKWKGTRLSISNHLDMNRFSVWENSGAGNPKYSGFRSSRLSSTNLLCSASRYVCHLICNNSAGAWYASPRDSFTHRKYRQQLNTGTCVERSNFDIASIIRATA